MRVNSNPHPDPDISGLKKIIPDPDFIVLRYGLNPDWIVQVRADPKKTTIPKLKATNNNGNYHIVSLILSKYQIYQFKLESYQIHPQLYEKIYFFIFLIHGKYTYITYTEIRIIFKYN